MSQKFDLNSLSTTHLLMIGIWVAVVAFGLLFLYQRAHNGRGLAMTNGAVGVTANQAAANGSAPAGGSASGGTPTGSHVASTPTLFPPESKSATAPTDAPTTPAPTAVVRHTSLTNGTAVTVTGTPVCLPAKDTNGPQTLQCAMGIQGNDGFYYALKDNTPDYTYLSKIQNGKTATVSGAFSLSDQTRYQSEGTITITGVSQ